MIRWTPLFLINLTTCRSSGRNCAISFPTKRSIPTLKWRFHWRRLEMRHSCTCLFIMRPLESEGWMLMPRRLSDWMGKWVGLGRMEKDWGWWHCRSLSLPLGILSRLWRLWPCSPEFNLLFSFVATVCISPPLKCHSRFYCK